MISFWPLLLIAAGFAFGPGYQPIAATILPTLALLLWYGRTTSRPLLVFPLIWLACSVGSLIAYAGCFESSRQPSLDSRLTQKMIPFAISFGGAATLASAIDRFLYRPGLLYCVTGFPAIWTVLWATWYRVSIFGDFGSWHIGLALLEYEPLTRGVSFLFGSFSGGCFMLALLASLICHFSTRHFNADILHVHLFEKLSTPPTSRRLLTGIFGFMSLVVLLGSWLGVYPHSFYQYPVGKYAPSTFNAACIVRGNFETTFKYLESAHHKPDLVVWSELSMNAGTDSAALLKRATELSIAHDIIFGVSYSETISKVPFRNRNKVSLIVPPARHYSGNRTIILTYQKTHPVPSVEVGTEQGPGKLESVVTTIGTLSAAICFDLNFPFLDQLSGMNVSLLIQPSATWGPVSQLHSFTNKLRALDHGLTLFRCSSNGVSGVYDPWHRTLAEKVTLGRGDFMYASIPIRKKQLTLYGLIGFDCLPIACALLLLLRIFGRLGHDKK